MDQAISSLLSISELISATEEFTERSLLLRSVQIGVTIQWRYLVALGQMQLDAETHQDCCHSKSKTHRIAEECDHYGGADKRCSGKIRTCARGADVPKRQHKESQA